MYALLGTLDRHAVGLTLIWSDLAPRDNPATSRLEIPSVPRVDLSSARHVLSESLDDLTWLRRALLAYAQATADQERARA